MKKIMFLILLLANYVAISQVNYSTVDDFNRSDNYSMGTTSSGNSTWTENEESGHPEQLQIASNVLLAITGGVSGLEPTNASIDLTNEISGFDLGNGTYGWSFHFHLYRNPSGWGSSNYSLGWVLAGNESDFSSSTVDGWAVLWTATNDELVLGYFTDGISGNDPLTNVVQTGLDWDNSGSDGVNVRVEVDASGNWTFYWELGTAITVPVDIDANSATSSSADNTFFDDVNMKYSGPIWAHSTSSSSTSKGDFDNFNFGETISGGVDNPTNFTAATAGTDQIDLSWTQNASGDDVMVAYTTDGTFGTPVDGTSYSVGSTITGGGEVIFNGSATSFSHTGLTADTRYYYMAWSVDGSSNYSSGVSADTTTLANEPTADPSGFTATTNSASEITLTWTDASPAADYYLIKGSNVSYASITDPVDGTPESDGSLVQNVASGIGSHQFTGLAPNTTYYFQIYPYNGDNGSVNYKTDNPQQATATTDAANTDLIISEIADPKDVYQARFIELYNLSGTTIDFTTEDWYLCRQTNGGSWEDKKLTGSITAGGTYVAANYNGSTSDYFYTSYGFMADYDYGGTSGNGDDGYFLYYGGDHSTGTLIDAYGVIDEDGTGKDWEYTDTKAVRLRSVTSPNATWTANEWNILPKDQNTTDMTPAAHNEDVTWQGTTSTDWNTKGNNWSGTYGYIPDASFNVTIPNVTNAPVISAHSACNNLTLNSGSSLDLSVNIWLTVYGDLDATSGTFTVKSDANGNGSVIVKGTVTGNTTVQRYFVGYSGGGNGWHLIGSPVNNMSISGSDFDPTGTSDDLYQWNESTDIWENYKQSHFTNFVNGKGYLCAFQNTGTKNFTGILNVSNITVSGLTLDSDGWHILGNPFPSSLEWNNGDWTLNNIAGIAKKYDEPSGNYLDLAAGDIVPSTNGFFVQATSGGASVTIPKSARVHSTVNNFKKGTVNTYKETLTLKITNDKNTYYDLTRVGFKFEATQAWDPEFDSHKLFGDKSAPQLWTIVNGDYFSWNNLPYSGEEYHIPLHFKAGVNSTFHITAEGFDSFYGTTQIFLEDLFTGQMIDLTKQQVYDFTGKTDDDEARFVLHFNGITAVGETPESHDASVYSFGNRVYIRFSQIPQSGYQIEVYNTLGQQVYAGKMEPNILNSIRLDEKTGIYIVRVITSNGIMVQKVMIK